MFLSFLLIPFTMADTGKFTFVAKGQPAPFEGALFDPLATADILADAQTDLLECEVQCRYELSKQEAKYIAELKKKDITIDARTREYEAALSYKQEEIDRLNKFIKRNSPARKIIFFTIGITAGTTLTYAAYQAFGYE